jgi:hypothetical protein
MHDALLPASTRAVAVACTPWLSTPMMRAKNVGSGLLWL